MTTNGFDIAQAIIAREQYPRPRAELMLGWVTGKTSTTVHVTLPDTDESYEMTRLQSYANPRADDVVLCLVGGETMWCIGTISDTNTNPPPRPPPDPTPPPSKPTTRTKTFKPGWTGYWRNGSWNKGKVRQGNLGTGMRYGAAYYGNGPSGLKGNAISGKIRVRRVAEGRDGYSVRPTFRLLNAKSKPSGKPGYSKQMRGPTMKKGEEKTVSIPESWCQDLIDGRAGGIGIGIEQPTPHLALLGKDGWAPAFALTIKYKS